MDPILLLEEPSLQVEPGAELRTRLRVRNGGEQPERYRLEVLGDAARWAQVEPRHLAVPPDGRDHTAEVVFRPPHAAATPAVEVAFAVRAHSLEHRDRAAVVEGELRVAAVPDLTALVEPAVAAGRWGAGFRLRFTNTGRAPLSLRVTAGDAPQALRYAVAPRQVALDPGEDAEVLVSVRTRTPKLVGAPVRHAFAVDHRADTGNSAGRSPAVFEQRAVLPTPLAGLLAVVAAALVVGAALLLVGPGAPAAPDAVAAPGAPPAAPAAPGPPTAPADAVSGHLVLYGPPVPVDDTASSGAAERFLDRLTGAGVQARIVDSRESTQLDDGPRGLLLVLRDGFPDRAAAEAECAAHRDVAPDCVVVAPR